MIRINLLPAKKRRSGAGKARALPIAVGGGQWWMLGMAAVWLLLIGLGAWLVSLEEERAAELRRQTADANKKIEETKKDINEEELQRREAQVEQLRVAIEKLEQKRRTPAFVMYELAMILTDGSDGGGPDIDEEKYRQSVKADPQSEINEQWDPTGLWLVSMKEEGGTLRLEGQARDATDLTEFTRRLRASARFGSLSHPDFQRVNESAAAHDARHLNWKLDVAVQRWD